MEKTNYIELESLLQHEEFIRLMNESLVKADRQFEKLKYYLASSDFIKQVCFIRQPYET